MKPRPGQALASPVDTTTVIVVRAPDRGLVKAPGGNPGWQSRIACEPCSGACSSLAGEAREAPPQERSTT